MENNTKNSTRKGITAILFAAIMMVIILAVTAVSVSAQESYDVCIWDFDGNCEDFPYGADCLCNHGHQYNIGVKSSSFTIAEATQMNSITFELYYTTCQNGGNWNFYLNDVLLGTASNADDNTCSCTPNANAWPQTVAITDTTTLNSAWNFGGTNELKVEFSGHTDYYVSWYEANISYETNVHAVAKPESQTISVGGTANFNASESYVETGSIVSYEWDFGDGTNGSGVTTSHTYATEDIYTVKLTVTDDAGRKGTDFVTVYVIGDVPTADADGPYVGDEGWPVTFDGSGSFDTEGIVKYEWDFGDGTTGYGMNSTHTYLSSGEFDITLTVYDAANQSDTDTTTASIENAVPVVVCVPWQGDEDLPHLTWSGEEITLKGTVIDIDAETYEWDFGDGSGTETGTVTDPYAIEARHTYTGADGTLYVTTLTVWDEDGAYDSDTYLVIIADKTLEVESDVAIDEGLWWLHKQQNRYTDADIDFGYWQTSYRVAHTGAAVQAFENNMHKPYGNPTKDPYVETVRRGLNYLTTKMEKVDGIPADDGDTNGNGFGIACYDESYVEMYEIGIAMMAIISSDTPGREAVAGPDGVIGRTYSEIMQDMADFCAYAQNDNGGWRYSRNYGGSDNSVTQWPIIGMEPAEVKWSVTVHEIVRPRLEDWLNGTQCTVADWRYGGFGYTSACDWDNVAKTAGTGITGLMFCDVPVTDDRIQNAIGFVDTNWASDNFGNIYAMYGVMKAYGDEFLEMESTGSHIWWDEYARYLVDTQQADGHWNEMGYGESNELTTAWAILILRSAVIDVAPTAVAKANGLDATEVDMDQTVYFDGSQSRDGTYHIVLYEWDWESDGTYDYASEDPTAEHAYSAYDTYIVTLRVTDNRDIVTSGAKPPMTDTDTCTVYVHPPPHPPIADANGPYIGWIGDPVTLDGSGSYDPNEPYDEIVSWDWDLDNDGEFDDASGETVSYTWDEPGIYPIALWVTASEEPHDCVEASRTIVEIGNHDPVADANGPYETRPCTPVTLDGSGSYDPDPDDYIVSYEWDLDNDGEYDDATGESTEFHSDDEGVYTIGLKVTDTFGATDTARTTVSVGNLAPIADADGPYSGLIGEPVLLDGSGSYDPDEDLGDEIVSWDWDLDGDGYFDDASGEKVEYTWEEKYSGEVCLKVTDKLGATGTDCTDTDICANQPPVANAGLDQTVEQIYYQGADVMLDGSGSYDLEGDPLTYSWTWPGGSATSVSPTVSLPLGTTTITLVVNDGTVDSDPDTVNITVVDTTPPDITVTVTPDTLWPPNHKMVDIVATVTVSDICDAAPTVVLTSLTSNEPDDAKGNGDGNTVNDIQEAEIGTEDYEFQLRAERAGKGDGRVYTITYTVTDASGNSASASATVVVPHDMG